MGSLTAYLDREVPQVGSFVTIPALPGRLSRGSILSVQLCKR